MFITLTNASPAFKGQAVILNSQVIVSVRRGTITRDPVHEDGETVIEDVTFVHCPPHGVWEVEETLEAIVKLLA